MQVDPDSAGAALGGADVKTTDRLCTSGLEIAADALGGDGTTLIACGQMSALFEDLAEDLGASGSLVTVDIRDRAGWTADDSATAKQAALLAEATLPIPVTPARDVVSEGTCLLLGAPHVALEAAEALSARLAVTCMLSGAPDDLVPTADYDIALGRLKSATGALGGFNVTIDGYRPVEPGGRGAAGFGNPIDGAKSTCDIIVDLRGEGPLFSADHKREGYLRADPRDPLAMRAILANALELQGVFEKPLYVRFEEALCAHSRAGRPGCDRCVTVCPTGAITSDGDTVVIDSDICAGCGACAAVCPSGAASYDDPPVGHLFSRLSTLGSAFRKAGGRAPRALFHDPEHGGEMIRLSARFGRGLPADVIPVEVPNVEGVGHAEILAALGVGFSGVAILPGPRTDLEVPERELALAQAILQDDTRVAILDASDPDRLEAALYGTAPEPLASDPILPLGGRREVTRNAAASLTAAEVPIPLPEGAPYGTVTLDTDACTLCLACVSLCPVGALGDNPEKPQVRFQEAACLQCGICASACPESAIALTPQLDLSTTALSHRVLHE